MINEIENKKHAFLQKLEIWLFYLFLATGTLSVRKIIYMRQIRSSFNEYASIYIYLSDIVLISIFLLFILNNKKDILSNIKTTYTEFKMFHVEHLKPEINIVSRGTMLFKKTYAHVVNKYWLFFPLVAVFFSFVSILWITEWKIGLFRSLKLLEFVLLYFYIIRNVPRGTLRNVKCFLFHVEQNNITESNHEIKMKSNCSTWNKIFYGIKTVPRGTVLVNSLFVIVVIGFIQSIIGIFQFVLQKSIGFFWLKESIISINTPSVAKLLFHGDIYIRAYGLFPHPNVFAGYLVFSIMINMFFLKMFHVEQSDLQLKKCSTWNKSWTLILIVQMIALVLTFSKSAFFGLFIGLFCLNISKQFKNVPRGTIKNIEKVKMFHVEQFRIKLLFSLCVILSTFLFLKPDLNTLFIKSLKERDFYLNVSRGTIIENPLLGVGTGQFIFVLEKIKNIENWQFQPVHNVFLLIASEYGLLFVLFFILFLLSILNCSTWNNLKKEVWLQNYLKAVMLAFVFIMMFDHYLWDIQQGSIMLWLLLAMLVAANKEVKA